MSIDTLGRFSVRVDELALAAVNDYHADQKPWELAQLGRIIRMHGCDRLVEVGTFRGGTAWFFHALGMHTTTIDIDPARRFVTLEQVNYVEGDSVEMLPSMKADVVFIDGAHSYAGVAADFALAMPVVGQGGLVAFHDIVEHAPGSGCEVHRLWEQIKNQWPHIEIIDPAPTANGVAAWAGIGVIRV